MNVQLITDNKKNILRFSSIDNLTSNDESSIIDNLCNKQLKSIYASVNDKNFSSLLVAEIYRWSQLLQKYQIQLMLQKMT